MNESIIKNILDITTGIISTQSLLMSITLGFNDKNNRAFELFREDYNTFQEISKKELDSSTSGLVTLPGSSL